MQPHFEFSLEWIRELTMKQILLLSMFLKLLHDGKVTLPTEGKPMRATLASPDFKTSKPSPFSPDFFDGSSSCDRYLANFALSKPRWYSVAKTSKPGEPFVTIDLMISKLTFVFLRAGNFSFNFRNLLKNTHFARILRSSC